MKEDLAKAQLDIHERILYEAALKKAKEDAERAHSTKTVFLENISQELRNPVNAIVGFIDILFQQLWDCSMI
jgi:signal transduction histidine kinase